MSEWHLPANCKQIRDICIYATGNENDSQGLLESVLSYKYVLEFEN